MYFLHSYLSYLYCHLAFRSWLSLNSWVLSISVPVYPRLGLGFRRRIGLHRLKKRRTIGTASAPGINNAEFMEIKSPPLGLLMILLMSPTIDKTRRKKITFPCNFIWILGTYNFNQPLLSLFCNLPEAQLSSIVSTFICVFFPDVINYGTEYSSYAHDFAHL